jgi:hypothetical protein
MLAQDGRSSPKAKNHRVPVAPNRLIHLRGWIRRARKGHRPPKIRVRSFFVRQLYVINHLISLTLFDNNAAILHSTGVRRHVVVMPR